MRTLKLLALPVQFNKTQFPILVYKLRFSKLVYIKFYL